MIDTSIDTETAQQTAYNSQLLSPMWRMKREDILRRDQHRCKVCGGQERLQVHHKCYLYLLQQQRHVHVWNYPDRMLVTLCQTCHEQVHQSYKIPTYTL